MIVTVKELEKLYQERKNDEDILNIRGLEFVPGYLKYLIIYAKGIKIKQLDIMPREGEK